MGLYTNSNGRVVNTNSFSGGSQYRECPRKYKYRRIDGYREREHKASREFGKCIEDAIKIWYESEKVPTVATAAFTQAWFKYQTDPDLTYTEKEESWAGLLQMGCEMMRLYEIVAPSLPFVNPRFQLNYRKEVCPGSYLGGIEQNDYIDLRCKTPAGNLLVVDIKTSGVPYPEQPPGIAAMDPQLREYAWISGIQDVAWLVFVKTNPSLKTGQRVQLLVEPFGEAEVAEVLKDGEISIWDSRTANEYKIATEGIKGKGAEKKKEEIYAKFVADGLVHKMNARDVTKQRIQFIPGHVSTEVMTAVGQGIAKDIADIFGEQNKAPGEDKFPMRPGVKFPDNKCLYCEMLGLCLGNKALQEERLLQITPAAEPAPVDWLEED